MSKLAMQSQSIKKFLLPGLILTGYAAVFFFLITPWTRFVLFVVGLVLGWVFLLLDEFYLRVVRST
ncbi:MAG: hypothetical protein GF390_00685, partial [Candidatus Pacebacteria bacterium]|nr:hypothetical protein [Candidatus Paceibacterota bacterium]